MLLAVLIMFAGFRLLDWAAQIAIRRQTNIWTAAKPEAGGALLLLAMALLFAALSGGWL